MLMNPQACAALEGFSNAARSIANDWANRSRRMIAAPKTADLEALFTGYAAGIGTFTDVTHYRFRQLLDELGSKLGVISPTESFFENSWRIKPDIVERFCPRVADISLALRDNSTVTALDLLDPGPNELMSLAWPSRIAGFGRRPRRPPLRAYSTDDAALYAHPFRYQVMSRDLTAFYETGSPRCLTTAALALSEVPTIETDRPLVLVQDRFEFRNFSHFLFDAVTRVFHYCEAYGYKGEIFVMGSVPGRYHEIITDALGKVVQVPKESFVYPTGACLFRTSARCTWFSDQKELHTHPAQMAHPRSITAFGLIGAQIPNHSTGVRRVYVSRGDAAHRRIINEADLIEALQARGFVSVELSRIPIEEQIGLFQGAEVVVAPHGMGLTNLALSRRLGQVIELFHPTAGTDAYSLVARGAGMRYDMVIGRAVAATPADFEIDAARVIDLLEPEGGSKTRPNWLKSANLISQSRTLDGLMAGDGSSPDDLRADVEAMMWGQAVRASTAPQQAAGVLAKWKGIPVAPGLGYTVSCWVRFPCVDEQAKLRLRIGDWPKQVFTHAAADRAGEWQRITCSAVAPLTAPVANLELVVEGSAGGTIQSTCWQLERGRVATAYLATG